MSNPSKTFLTFDEQIDYLQQKKNLVITDPVQAKTILEQIGYSSLIGGYKAPFKNSTTKKYRDGTTFEQIVLLYKFDEELRELFLKYILRIERQIRSLLSYYFSDKYGEQQCNYLNPSNYTNNTRSTNDVAKLISTLNDLANKNKDYPFIVHQRTAYGNVPLWILVNYTTFGTLSKLYSLLTQDIQVKISKHFFKVNEKQLEQFLSVITKFRNVCAHNERLFLFKARNDIPDMTLHQKLGIPKTGTQYSQGKKDLFSIVIAFRYLLPDQDFKIFKTALIRVLNNYVKSTYAMSENDLYNYMGFPLNWNKVSTFKK